MFVLDSRLQLDTVVLGAFALSQLLLSKDANYPWFILVRTPSGVTALFDLDAAVHYQM